MLLKLNFVYFFVSFAIGLLFCYILSPAPEVILKFPSPYNAGSIVYRDEKKEDSCYVYQAENVACPMDRNRIRPQP